MDGRLSPDYGYLMQAPEWPAHRRVRRRRATSWDEPISYQMVTYCKETIRQCDWYDKLSGSGDDREVEVYIMQGMTMFDAFLMLFAAYTRDVARPKEQEHD